ncbi:MAG: SOS response-associated peptidase, partial [Actinophytocola sp.]|nr:SOS response-associated peptidase [Actinophytocola sp.]
PWFMKDSRGAAGKINARAETLTTTRAFRQAAARRRALIPMDGWYEWRSHPKEPGKQPYFLTSEVPLTAAGVWERWRGPDGAELLTCAIVTTAAVGPLVDIHDRMPLLLPADRWDDWLDPIFSDPTSLLTPDTDVIAGLELRPVGPGIGDVRNKTSPDLVARIDL